MSSFFSQILQPGGGIMLLPFIRGVIGLLLLLTTTAAVFDVARIHMVILSFLSAGLLVSLSFFESEYNKVQRSHGSAPVVAGSSGSNNNNKTD